MSWRDLRLGDVVTLRSGGTPSKSDSRYWGGEIPWLSSKDLVSSRIFDAPLHVTEVGVKSGSRLMPENTVMFVVRGMSLASEFRVSITRAPCAFNQDLKAAECSGEILPNFLFYSLFAQREQIRSQAGEASHGTKKLETHTVENIRLRVPDLSVQERVIEIASCYDDLIENNRRRIALLEEAARLLYREWFVLFRFPGHEHVKIIDGLPEGWRNARVQDAYLGLFDGPHATPSPSDEGPIFLGIKNIREAGGLDLSNIRHVSESDFPKWTRRVEPEEGDIVFSYEATLNRYALIPRGLRCCLGRRMALIRPKEEFRYFLYQQMFSETWRQAIAARILVGATVDRIPLSSFPDFPILLPPRNLAAHFNEAIEPQYKMINALREQNQKLAEARDILLPRLMSGEITV